MQLPSIRNFAAKRGAERSTLRELEKLSDDARKDEAPISLAQLLREEYHALHPGNSDAPHPGAAEAGLSDIVDRIH